ncbi:hypothetical protein Patl1_13505 [Pistacia atlantica]|uniref:Uncharacterized protein n=1 Tax=Pistacia atlantica TaxID=434234 RepID=A0ACC1AUK6_9ROSI|nr:hypothetical protein Patl1_13505 [Pistacia atlantica]
MLTGSLDMVLVARLMHGRLGLVIEREERNGSFTSESVAESIRRVLVEKEGKPLRASMGYERDFWQHGVT